MVLIVTIGPDARSTADIDVSNYPICPSTVPSASPAVAMSSAMTHVAALAFPMPFC